MEVHFRLALEAVKMEAQGIEPRPTPCKGAVLPLDYASFFMHAHLSAVLHDLAGMHASDVLLAMQPFLAFSGNIKPWQCRK